MTRPTPVAEFSDQPTAAIACGMLRSNGIEATVVNDEMATIYGAGATWAPVRLYVDAGDTPLALRLLREHGDI